MRLAFSGRPLKGHKPQHIIESANIRHWCTGARLAFGGRPLEGHSIPACYGAMEPTAVFVPLAQLLSTEHFPVATTELFGPFQVGLQGLAGLSRDGCVTAERSVLSKMSRGVPVNGGKACCSCLVLRHVHAR